MTNALVPVKPHVSTVLALGYGHDEEREFPALVVQMRGYINPANSRLVVDAGMPSLWGKHVQDGRDFGSNEIERYLSAAMHCANMEFWNGEKPLVIRDFQYIGGPVETDQTINTLFMLNHRLRIEDIKVREGLGVGFIPLHQLPEHLDAHVLTEASVGTLGLVSEWYYSMTGTPADVTTALQQAWHGLPDLVPSRLQVTPEEFRLIQLLRKQNPALTTQLGDIMESDEKGL